MNILGHFYFQLHGDNNLNARWVIIQVNMLIRKINNVKGQRVRVSTLAGDPHGKMVCIYQHTRGEFILIEIPSIYRLFEQYRIDYFTNNSYDVKHQLPHLLIFQSEQILQLCPRIKFSQIYQEDTQFIAIYFTTFVEIVKISLKTFEVIFRVLFKLTTQILELNIISENIYISMYDGSIFNISLHRIETKKKGDICKKISFINESMKRQHIGISQSTRLDEDRNEGYKIWQTFNGRLMYNRSVLSNEFQDNFDYQNSFEEYLGRELNEMHPIKYEMSHCREYIIGSSLGKIINEKKAVYTIKARWCDWSHLCEVSLKPEINPFWTSYQQSMNEQSNWGFPLERNHKNNGNTKMLKSYKTDKIMLAYYCPAQCSLIVSWIIVDKSLKKKVSNAFQNKKGKEQSVELVKYTGTQKVILRVSYLKSRLSEMRWIGLNQLLTIDEDFNLLFVQFDPYVLRN